MNAETPADVLHRRGQLLTAAHELCVDAPVRAAGVLVDVAEFLRWMAAGCTRCSGKGKFSENWVAYRLRNRFSMPYASKSGSVGLGKVWQDCPDCRQIRDLAARCAGVKR